LLPRKMGGNASLPAHPQGKKMQAIAFDAHGEADKVLKKVDVPYPHGFNPELNVVIKVHCASINPIDKLLMEGKLKMMLPVRAFPHPIAYDASGVVEVADSKGKFAVGDAVMVRLFGGKGDGPKTPWYRGSMVEFCVASTDHTVKKPANISFEEAAGTPLAGLTALQSLRFGGLKEGGSVFITGGAGGVGTFAIQLAKHVFKAGLVVTTASAGPKAELCKSLGADVVVDYRTSKFEDVYSAEGADKFDVCFDTTNESLKCARIVKRGGHIVTVAGNPTLEEIPGASCIVGCFVPKKAAREEFHAAEAVGAKWDHLFLKPSGEDLNELAGHLAAGTIKTILHDTWDLDDFKGAFDMQFSGRSKGKCVVRFVKS